ncbi:MAG: hypothetical protein ACOYUZ_06520 [Patescibacteria group bacterium]
MRSKKIPIQKVKNRRRLCDIMTPNFWLIHYSIPATIALLFLGMALGMAHFTFRPASVNATASDNIRGWAWTPVASWISLNDQNPNACSSPPCGSYGIHMDPAVSNQPHWDPGQPPGTTLPGHKINGFVWSDNLGFICFGESCNIPDCHGGFYPSWPGGTFFAYAEQVSGTNFRKLHGWAVICNQNKLGWISLSCQDTGSCTGGNTEYYQLVYNPTDKKYHNAADPGSPFAWNGNTDNTGIGYISFFTDPSANDGMHLVVSSETTYADCHDGIDNDLNGSADCSDASCSAVCTENCSNGLDDDGDGDIDCADSDCSCTESICDDSVDNDLDGNTDCADPDCAADPICLPEGDCTDGADNDGDSLTDCADPDCALDPACVPPQHQCLAYAGDPDQANLCCNDQITNGAPAVDCFDIDCQNNAAVCAAWLKVDTGNIYAFGGIEGTAPSKATNQFNATYCLRSDQTIDWSSEKSCEQEGVGEIELPSLSTNYRNKLGFLDLDGIRTNNRYGRVWTIGSAAELPNQLNGAIYRYTGPGEFNLPAKEFENGTGSTGNGSGLLLIEGADLRISGNITYSTDVVQTRLKNLASFGVIVVKNALGQGGNIYIEPSVSKISGVYFAEGAINTGTAGAPDQYLEMIGAFIANQFNLQRDNNTDPAKPAENIIFDGRAVVNPPPGMQDAAKSLPQLKGVTF